MNKFNTFKLYYRLILKDKDGNVIKKTRLRKSKSFLLQFLQLHVEFLGLNSGLSIKDIGGTMRGGMASNNQIYVNQLTGGANDTTRGIVVGTGTDAVANADYKLKTLIAAGSSAGQLSYGSQSYVATSVVGANVDLVLSRVVTNNSGDTITVEEIGLYVYWANSWNAYTFCIIHDLAEQEILDGQSLTVQYTLRTIA